MTNTEKFTELYKKLEHVASIMPYSARPPTTLKMRKIKNIFW